MTTFERIKKLAKNRGVTLQKVANELGFGESTLYKWKKQTPNGEYLAKVADYFHVSVDYLLGRENSESVSDQKDLKKFLDDNLNYGMTYDGQNLTDEEKERLKIALTQVFYKYKDKFKKD
ncbi:helix-turn-helix transcriptional regulator [Ligilactobacillus aviarius]|uniref:helix-turn-helix domain-containing protein n=1 Tax=Ligilactobacillus TaxID=2767887 RepID=UPI0025A46995|nr:MULTISPECIES: helix-turn-helix transcriptional regulator [Ligilactobacillus]MDM8277810.1 helix-turn-helix transcriptional regulator [Ligilactobacillus aviarius]MDO3393241.1 helix-turn-helix transcriptional regulator [Ligilactobacillus sp. 110_WCHN]